MSESTGRTVSPPTPRSGREHEAPVLQLRMHHHPGGMLALQAAGEIDATEAGQFAESVRTALSSAAGTVVLDLSRVTLLSTAGVVVLTEAAHRAFMRNLPLVLVTNSRPVDRVLSALELVDQFDYADSLEAALSSRRGRGTSRPHLPAARGHRS